MAVPVPVPHAPGLEVTAAGRSCYGLSGRFVVLEASFAPNGDVTSFAADFEQHCEGYYPALLGSFRYNSSVPSEPRLSVASGVDPRGRRRPTTLTFLVSLSARSDVPVSVGYATSDGTAKAGTDYVASSGFVSFVPGQTVASVDVPVLDNAAAEPDRTLTLSLSNPAGAPIAFGQATGTILDDDAGRHLHRVRERPGRLHPRGQTFTLTPLDGTITVTGRAAAS